MQGLPQCPGQAQTPGVSAVLTIGRSKPSPAPNPVTTSRHKEETDPDFHRKSSHHQAPCLMGGGRAGGRAGGRLRLPAHGSGVRHLGGLLGDVLRGVVSVPWSGARTAPNLTHNLVSVAVNS